MHQQYRVPIKNNTKTNKSFVFHATFVVLSLCYLIFNLVLDHKPIVSKKSNVKNLSLALPEIEPQIEPPKTAQIKPIKKTTDWVNVTARAGDNLGSIFKRMGLTQQNLQAVIHDSRHAKKLASIKPNQKIQLLIRNQVLEKLITQLNLTEVLVVSLNNKHYSSQINLRETNNHHEYITATIRGSLYNTAKHMNIPGKLIREMTEIFNWELDFAKDIRSGDQFSIIYDALYVDDKFVGTGDILAVTFTSRGKNHTAIRHENAAGNFDYFTPEGVSLKKAFSRYPVKFSHISSTFSLSRKHPILHYSRPHKGVDLAAPIGTPIHATGDGRIEVIGRRSDYGNMVKISHNKTYTSIYGHLLKFQKGLSRGDFVKRGQVIGYVGQSGLATAPHCHYEFHINKQPRNPSTIELPRASPVLARERNSFKTNANTMLARLKLYQSGNLARSTYKKSVNTG